MDRDRLRDELAARDGAELADFLAGLWGREAGLDREIEAFAARRNAPEHHRKLQRWIRSVGDSSRFVGYHASFDVAEELEALVGEIETVLTEGKDAPSALRLAEDLLEAGAELLQRTDDSAGVVSDKLREVPVFWLRAAGTCRDEGMERPWAERVHELRASDDLGLFDRLLPSANLLLQDDELRGLAERYEAEARKGAAARDYAALHARVALGSLAYALRDPSLYVRSVTLASPEPNERQRASIAECFLELGDPAGAIEWLEGPWEIDEYRRLSLLDQAAGELGDEELRREMREKLWNRSPSPESLEAYLEVLTAEERQAVIERVVEEAARPLAATLVYRALLTDILGRGYSRAYHHAARYYRELERLASAVEDWRDVPDHGAFVEELRQGHGRKSSFWSHVGGLPGSDGS